LLVEDKIILELKSLEDILPLHEAQLLTYLKLSDKNLGLVINFNFPLLKEGVRRRINDRLNILCDVVDFFNTTFFSTVTKAPHPTPSITSELSG